MKIGNVISTNPVTNSVPRVEPTPSNQTASVHSSSTPKTPVKQSHLEHGGNNSDARADLNEDALLEESVNQANHTLKAYDRVIDRTIHPETKAVIYTIKDTKTNEVIAEFPSKKIQDMMAKMWELAGMFVDDKA